MHRLKDETKTKRAEVYFLTVYVAAASNLSEFLTAENIMTILLTNKDIRLHNSLLLSMTKRFWQDIYHVIKQDGFFDESIQECIEDSTCSIPNNNSKFDVSSIYGRYDGMMISGGLALKAFTGSSWNYCKSDLNLFCSNNDADKTGSSMNSKSDLDLFFNDDVDNKMYKAIHDFLIRNNYVVQERVSAGYTHLKKFLCTSYIKTVHDNDENTHQNDSGYDSQSESEIENSPRDQQKHTIYSKPKVWKVDLVVNQGKSFAGILHEFDITVCQLGLTVHQGRKGMIVVMPHDIIMRNLRVSNRLIRKIHDNSHYHYTRLDLMTSTIVRLRKYYERGFTHIKKTGFPTIKQLSKSIRHTKKPTKERRKNQKIVDTGEYMCSIATEEFPDNYLICYFNDYEL
jgi:hypothetical protein